MRGKSKESKRRWTRKKSRSSAFLLVLHGILGKSSSGALLRERRVTGRDASLPAPLLSTFGILVARGTVGALPQTPQGTLFLDPARGRRKGTKSPLDPFSRLSWSHFHAPSACSFLVHRRSPCLLPPTFREEPFYCTKKEKPLMQLPLIFAYFSMDSSQESNGLMPSRPATVGATFARPKPWPSFNS